MQRADRENAPQQTGQREPLDLARCRGLAVRAIHPGQPEAPRAACDAVEGAEGQGGEFRVPETQCTGQGKAPCIHLKEPLVPRTELGWATGGRGADGAVEGGGAVASLACGAARPALVAGGV